HHSSSAKSKPGLCALSLHDALPISPERGLVDPVRLAEDLVAEAEGVEHLDRPHGDAVRLPEAERPAASLDDAGVDPGELRELRRSEEHTSELQSRENLVCRLLLEKT